jgi:hypothetical protein
MLNTKRSFGVRPRSATSLANPTALKTKKTPSRKRKKDLRERVFQKDVGLLIKMKRVRESYHISRAAQQRPLEDRRALLCPLA